MSIFLLSFYPHLLFQYKLFSWAYLVLKQVFFYSMKSTKDKARVFSEPATHLNVQWWGYGRGQTASIGCDWGMATVACKFHAGYNENLPRSWNRLPVDVILASSLSEFRNCLDNSLRHMVWFLGLPSADAGAELDDSRGSLLTLDILWF